MSGVRMLHFLKRFMKIHSNPPILYYGFKEKLAKTKLKEGSKEHQRPCSVVSEKKLSQILPYCRSYFRILTDVDLL